MKYNINLWFAETIDGEIEIINDADKNKEYICPICRSKVIPKAINEDSKVGSHYAHVDKSKCNNETMVHWWVKNQLMYKGCKFEIKEGRKSKHYVCSSFDLEQSIYTPFGEYKPDITLITETNKTIYIEVAHTNKKDEDLFKDKWMYLNNTVIEISTKDIVGIDGRVVEGNELIFRAKYYSGKYDEKETNKTNKDADKINNYKIKTINKSEMSDEDIENIKSLNWFWDVLGNYIKSTKNNIKDFSDNIDKTTGEARKIIMSILTKPRCRNVLREFIEYKYNEIYKCVDVVNEYTSNEYSFALNCILCDFEYHVKYDCVWNIGIDDKMYNLISRSTNDILNEIDKYYDEEILRLGIKSLVKNINKLKLGYSISHSYSGFKVKKSKKIFNRYCLNILKPYGIKTISELKDYLVNKICEYKDSIIPIENVYDVYNECKSLAERYNNNVGGVKITCEFMDVNNIEVCVWYDWIEINFSIDNKSLTYNGYELLQSENGKYDINRVRNLLTTYISEWLRSIKF